jgi:hypothetical protein
MYHQTLRQAYRTRDPLTSRQSFNPNSDMCQAYEAIKAEPGLTAGEVADRTGRPSIWKRCSDLENLGWIETRLDPQGNTETKVYPHTGRKQKRLYVAGGRQLNLF